MPSAFWPRYQWEKLERILEHHKGLADKFKSSHQSGQHDRGKQTQSLGRLFCPNNSWYHLIQRPPKQFCLGWS